MKTYEVREGDDRGRVLGTFQAEDTQAARSVVHGNDELRSWRGQVLIRVAPGPERHCWTWPAPDDITEGGRLVGLSDEYDDR